MLDIQKIKNDILKNERKYIFDHINFLGNFNDIEDYIVNTNEVMYDFVNKNRKKNHLAYLLKLINSYLENKKVLIPMMQNISSCSGVVLVEKDQSLEDIKGQIPNSSYFEVTKDNFHIYEENLIEFLKVSLSFKADVLFPTVNLSRNKELKDLIKQQFLYNIGEFRSYIKKNETNDYIDEDIKHYKELFLTITDENIDTQQKIKKYECLSSDLFINTSNIWHSINCQWNKTGKFKQNEADVILYIDKITKLNNDYNLNSTIRNLDRDSLLYIYTNKEELKSYLKNKYILYNKFIDYKWNSWKPSYIFDVINEFNTYSNGDFEDKVKKINDILCLIDGKKNKLPKNINEKIIELKKEIIIDLETSSLNLFEEKLQSLFNKKYLYENYYTEIMNLPNIKILLQNNKIITENKIELNDIYIKLKYPDEFYFLLRYKDKIMEDNKQFLTENINGTILVFENTFDISMEVFEKYVFDFLDVTYQINANKHDEAFDTIKQYFNSMIREIKLVEKINTEEKNIAKPKKKI